MCSELIVDYMGKPECYADYNILYGVVFRYNVYIYLLLYYYSNVKVPVLGNLTGRSNSLYSINMVYLYKYL